MTREEAISILKQYIDYNNPDVPDFYTMEEAIEVVIKALKQEPCEDAISRQAAIDACLNGWNKDYKEIVKEIRALPPVTAEKPNKRNKSEARRWKRRYLDLKQRIFKLEEQTRWIPVSEIEDIKAEINELSELNHIEPTYEDCKRDVLEILDRYKASPTGEEVKE